MTFWQSTWEFSLLFRLNTLLVAPRWARKTKHSSTRTTRPTSNRKSERSIRVERICFRDTLSKAVLIKTVLNILPQRKKKRHGAWCSWHRRWSGTTSSGAFWILIQTRKRSRVSSLSCWETRYQRHKVAPSARWLSCAGVFLPNENDSVFGHPLATPTLTRCPRAKVRAPSYYFIWDREWLN